MEKIRKILIILIPALIIAGFGIASIVQPDRDYSEPERRVMASIPEFSVETLSSGKFADDFEDYALDQFTARDGFRTMKALINKYVFWQKDNNGMYIVDGHISKMNYPLNEAKLKTLLQKNRQVYAKYIDGTDCKVYLSVIPDKNYFLAGDNGYLTIDYDDYVGRIVNASDYGKYIDIFPELTLEDYYKTDLHWKQENILPVAKRLIAGMRTETAAEGVYDTDFHALDLYEDTVDVDFYGAYYRQAALPAKPDTLKYLVWEGQDNLVVTSYNKGTAAPAEVYDMKKAHDRDPYEMFLGGSDALLTIDNPKAATDRELIFFRDSFGSSLAPLLTPAYKKITLVDLRYIQMDMIGQFVDFNGQDVLFMNYLI